jgi:membrane protein implicated in regulation of membrane protease activity
MLALLLAAALIALTVLALLFGGVVAAIVTGIVLLNVFAVLLRLRAPSPQPPAVTSERWRPSSFRRPPELPLPDEEDADELTVRRR